LIIDQLTEKNSKNRYILKDVSGSIFQNASLIFGINNLKILNYLNLHNDF
jgi:hypothetical protein